MKRVILLSVFVLLSFSALFAQNEQKKEKELIKKVIQTAYVDGLCNNADEEAVKKGFHLGFDLLSAGKGNTMWKLPIYNWIEIAKKGKKKGAKHFLSFFCHYYIKRAIICNTYTFIICII